MKLKPILFYYLFFIVTSFSSVESVDSLETHISLSNTETHILEKFLNCLIRDSEGGYVLYGKKPVCITAFDELDIFYGASQRHLESVCLKEGASLWRKISEGRNSNIQIHIYKKSDKNLFHVLVINKELFYETVQKNLVLFQYILGPLTNPTTLLARLTDPDETFHGVLKHDKVLIGILLGFGTQNALHISRIENLQEGLLSLGEDFPFEGRISALTNILGSYKDIYLLHEKPKTKKFDLSPSFSYNSLETEIIDTISKIEMSSEKLSQNLPYFIFGRLKNGSESDELIKDLEATQEKIIKLTCSETFLQDVCKMIYPEIQFAFNSTPINEPFSWYKEPPTPLSKVVGKNISFILSDENPSYKEGFYLGMHDTKNNIQKPSEGPFNDYQKLKVIRAAKENVDKANHFFSTLENDKQFTKCANGNVYYHTLEQGAGKQLNNEQTVVVHCKAITPSNEVLVDTWSSEEPIEADLNRTISGFPIGIKDMYEGEKREIYIHPNMAYGLYTNLEKGIYIKAEIQLIKIKSQNSPTPSLKANFFDFAPIFDKLSKLDFETISQNEGYSLGHAVWSHYKKEPSLLLSKVIDIIQKYGEEDEMQDEFDEDEQALFNHLHWYLYTK